MTKAKLSATIVVGDAVALAEGTGVGNLLGKGEGRGVGLPRIAVGMGVACVLFFEGAGDKDGRGVGFTVGLADGLGVGEGEGLIPQGHIRWLVVASAATEQMPDPPPMKHVLEDGTYSGYAVLDSVPCEMEQESGPLERDATTTAISGVCNGQYVPLRHASDLVAQAVSHDWPAAASIHKAVV